jgi:restriction endonuclease S subunit
MFSEMPTTPVKTYVDDSFPGEWGTEDTMKASVKVIRTTNFTNSGKLNLADVVTRSIEDRKVARKQIKKYDTILERSGGTADNPVGRVVLFEEDDLFLCNNFTQVLRFKDIDPRFAFYSLYYFYQTNKTTIRSMGSKTTGIQNLNMSKYLEIGIPNASDEEQNEFVAISEQADKSKFTSLKSQFIEMFGNLDTNIKSYPVTTVEKISLNLFAGGDKPEDTSTERTYKYIYPVWANGEGERGLMGYSKTYRVDKEALTISARGTIGYCAIREPYFTPIVRLITLIPNEKVDIVYLKYFFDQTGFESTGAVQGQLTIPTIKVKKVLVPPIEEQMKFAEVVKQADKSKYIN